jgi:CIC family chloride channel protein
MKGVKGLTGPERPRTPAEAASSLPLHEASPKVPSAAGFRRFGFDEDRFFLLLAVFIGIVSGLAVVCFRIAIEWSRIQLLGSSAVPSHLRAWLVPSLAGLVVGALVLRVFPTVRGSGVNQTKAALYIYNGYIPLRTAIGKFITSALAIGAGHSLGPEDPSLQIGATLASAVGQRLQLSRDKLRLLAPVGAAAGLAAAFNAPISAVLFVIEEVIGRWSAGILGAVVLSAVSSVVVTRWFFGAEPLFHIPAVEIIRPAELFAYAVLGLVGGIASIVFARGVTVLRTCLKAAPRWTQYLQPAVAGLLIGGIARAGFPQVMGAGYESIDQAMHNQFTWEVLGILAGLKILATTLSFASGTPGGMFAPTLFIGAMLGGAVGGVERLFFPALAGTAGTYALVGMGVLFAGFLRAPMTSVFMVLEVSGNYSIIVPVMIANTLAYLVSRVFVPVPIFDLLSTQDGLDLPSMEEQREVVALRVEDAMRPPEVTVAEADETLRTVWTQMENDSADLVFVHHAALRWTPIGRNRIKQLIDAGHDDMPAGSVVGADHVPSFYPDHPLHLVLPFLYEYSVLPVVSRAFENRLEGVLSLKDALRAYRRVGQHRFARHLES